MAIEDAAALGIIFSRKHFRGDLSECLAVYEQVRLPRATRVQAAAAKAASNINERIGESPKEPDNPNLQICFANSPRGRILEQHQHSHVQGRGRDEKVDH